MMVVMNTIMNIKHLKKHQAPKLAPSPDALIGPGLAVDAARKNC
jgi:hypothetical protein